jgi:hypothetical protein
MKNNLRMAGLGHSLGMSGAGRVKFNLTSSSARTQRSITQVEVDPDNYQDPDTIRSVNDVSEIQHDSEDVVEDTVVLDQEQVIEALAHWFNGSNVKLVGTPEFSIVNPGGRDYYGFPAKQKLEAKLRVQHRNSRGRG